MINTKVNKKNDIKITTKTTLIFYLQATSMNCKLCRALCSCWRWRRNFGCNAFVFITIVFFMMMLMAKLFDILWPIHNITAWALLPK